MRKRDKILIGTALLLPFGAGTAIGATSASTVTVKTVAGPTKTVTRYAGIKKVPVPGPTKTVYKTRYVPATQGPSGTVIARYSGSGTETTGSFSVPSSGDYIVKWSFSGNSSGDGGDNFIIDDVNQDGDAGDSANTIAVSGSGSTEDTQFTGKQSFNVQADDGASWDITVESAS